MYDLKTEKIFLALSLRQQGPFSELHSSWRSHRSGREVLIFFSLERRLWRWEFSSSLLFCYPLKLLKLLPSSRYLFIYFLLWFRLENRWFHLSEWSPLLPAGDAPSMFCCVLCCNRFLFRSTFSFCSCCASRILDPRTLSSQGSSWCSLMISVTCDHL